MKKTNHHETMPETARCPCGYQYVTYSDWSEEAQTQNHEYLPEADTEIPPPRSELPTLEMIEPELPEIDPSDVMESQLCK